MKRAGLLDHIILNNEKDGAIWQIQYPQSKDTVEDIGEEQRRSKTSPAR